MKPAHACLGGRPLPVSAPYRRQTPRRFRCSAEARDEEVPTPTTRTATPTSSPPPPPRPPPPDPEKRWRRLWGGNPHGVYRVPGVSDWIARAPQVRVRSTTDRQHEQLADLAVVNERLAGGSGPAARARVDFLRGRRLWARVYDVVTRSDVGATLDAIERATGEVRGALDLNRGGGGGGRTGNEGQGEGGGGEASSLRLTERERLGVAALRERLVSLQEQLAAATERIATSRAKLSHNEERLRSLKAAQEALEAALAREEEREKRGAGPAAAAARTSNSMPPPLPLPLLNRGTWLPLAFVSDLDRKPGIMLPVDVDGVPWVLFRTGLNPSPSSLSPPSLSDGGGGGETSASIPGDENRDSPIACLRDECAHRACPLSLGKVDAAGRAVCPYHGWAYDGLSGSCVEMPSTLHRRGVGVEAMKVGVRDGVVWGWWRRKEEEEEEDRLSSSPPPASSSPSLPSSHLEHLPLPPLPATAATPAGFVAVAEATVPNSASPPDRIRAALAHGGASLVTNVPASAATRGLLPPPGALSSSLSPPETIVFDGEEGGAVAVVTLASGFGSESGSSIEAPSSSSSLRPLRLLHLVAPGRDGGTRLLLRVCVAEGAVTAVFGSGKRRLWGVLAADAAEEDARLGRRGEEQRAAAAEAKRASSSVF